MKNITLLYAEDETDTRKDHIKYLKSRYDINIIEADDGLQAWELYQKHNPEIVLTDINMPYMSGIKLAQNIREVSLNTKIIMATALSDQDTLLQALDMSVVKYIVKPINRKKLNDSIGIALEALQQQNENTRDKHVIFTEHVYWSIDTQELFEGKKKVLLSQSENLAMTMLCEYKNKQISSYDLFVYVWEDLDKEFSSASVRTLIKKLRKKLPQDCIENIYGGFYRLHTQ